MSKPARFSYLFIGITLVMVGWLHLATPLITAFFAYFALDKLNVARNRWVAVVLFFMLVSGVFYGFVFFLRQALTTLPQIASVSIPLIIDYARAHGFDLPFDDVESLKALIIERLRS